MTDDIWLRSDKIRYLLGFCFTGILILIDFSIAHSTKRMVTNWAVMKTRLNLHRDLLSIFNLCISS